MRSAVRPRNAEEVSHRFSSLCKQLILIPMARLFFRGLCPVTPLHKTGPGICVSLRQTFGIVADLVSKPYYDAFSCAPVSVLTNSQHVAVVQRVQLTPTRLRAIMRAEELQPNACASSSLPCWQIYEKPETRQQTARKPCSSLSEMCDLRCENVLLVGDVSWRGVPHHFWSPSLAVTFPKGLPGSKPFSMLDLEKLFYRTRIVLLILVHGPTSLPLNSTGTIKL